MKSFSSCHSSLIAASFWPHKDVVRVMLILLSLSPLLLLASPSATAVRERRLAARSICTELGVNEAVEDRELTVLLYL